MITCVMKDGKMTLMCEGSLLALAGETVGLVKEIYNEIKKENAEAADEYKHMIKSAAEDEIMFDRNPIDALKSLFEEWEKDEESDYDDEEPDLDDEDFRTRALRELGGATEE